jgi:formylglycine-generating enzyme required for sulfatase activity
MKYLILSLLYGLFALAAPAQTRTGTDYAVFFYVTDFQPGIDDIPFTKGEAEELAGVLSSDYGFSCHYVRECKKDDITKALADWNKKLQAGDQVLFFFSMHGYYDRDSDRGYLIPADGRADAQHNYFTSWLSYDDLRTYLAPCKAGHVLVALDACFSGSFGIRSNKKIPDGSAADQKPDCATRIGNAMGLKGRQFITAGKTDQETPKRSVFAYEILATLRTGYDRDGMVFLDDLAYRLHKLKSPEPEDGTFVGHKAGGDFVFVRKNACNANAPDRDGDGVPDAADQCPGTWGSLPNGCPPADPGTDNTAADLAAWKTAKAANTKAAYQEYLRTFSNGEFKDPANAALRRIEAEELARRDDTAWEIATEKNTPEAYKKYVQDWPNGRHAAGAREKTKPQAEEKMPDGMVFVQGGTFQMGSESGESNEKPVHSVTVSDFYLGKYEVTVAEFKAFIDATNYKTDADKSGSSVVYTTEWKDQKGVNWKYDTRGNLRPSNEYNHPVLHVSWNDATEYCKWLSQKTGQTYRLPTEAEWEYAAGGGSGPRTKWAGTDEEKSLRRYANYDGNQDGHLLTAPVGSLQANALGLHDMSGNVWEWCGDWYGSYTASAQTDPTGASSGSYRVIRGGSWYVYPQFCRVADRSYGAPGVRLSVVGFRLARTK